MLYAEESLVVAAGKNEFWLLWCGEKDLLPVKAYPKLWKALFAARVVRKWADRHAVTVDDFLIRYFEGKYSDIPSKNRNQPTI